MSRTNPNKKKRRQANKTLLIFGEGLGEAIFLKHLRKLYSFSSDVKIKIKKGRGGDVKSIIIDASKILGAFDRRIVVLDNDNKLKKEMLEARQEAKKRKIEIIENTPCLESLFLLILGEKQNVKNSPWCKKKFQSEYMTKIKPSKLNEYDKLFPKTLLNSKRLKITVLNKLILIMEGK